MHRKVRGWANIWLLGPFAGDSKFTGSDRTQFPRTEPFAVANGARYSSIEISLMRIPYDAELVILT
jgi:hypothetical protein